MPRGRNRAQGPRSYRGWKGLSGRHGQAQIGLGVAAGQAQVIALLQDREDLGRDEGRRVRAQGDPLDAEVQQGQEDRDGLLLEPTDDQGQRQIGRASCRERV